jgi:cell division protein FtsL
MPSPVGNRKRMQRKGRAHSAFAAVAVFIGVLVMGLGGLRIYNMSLEQRLTRLNETIENYQELELDLRNKLASLLSPSRVYSVASAKMGMVADGGVAVVTVPPLARPAHSVALRPDSVPKAPVAGFSLAGLFEKEAHAQD